MKDSLRSLEKYLFIQKNDWSQMAKKRKDNILLKYFALIKNL